MLRSNAAKSAAAVAGALTLVACAMTRPAAIVGPQGVMLGSVSENLSGGSFLVVQDGLRCAGSYDASSGTATTAFSIRCNDGRKGSGFVTQHLGQTTGRVRFSDGYEAELIFGDAAASY